MFAGVSSTTRIRFFAPEVGILTEVLSLSPPARAPPEPGQKRNCQGVVRTRKSFLSIRARGRDLDCFQDSPPRRNQNCLSDPSFPEQSVLFPPGPPPACSSREKSSFPRQAARRGGVQQNSPSPLQIRSTWKSLLAMEISGRSLFPVSPPLVVSSQHRDCPRPL